MDQNSSVEGKIENCQSVQKLRWDGVDIILINRPECQASLSLFGAQLLSFQPKDEMPVLWQNPTADFSGTSAIRSGIPICWPWFNAIAMNSEEVQNSFAKLDHPSHGTVRDRVWELTDIEETSSATVVKLQTLYSEKNLQLEASFSLGEKLEMTLTTTNQSDETLAFSCALHSYFAVSDIAQAAVAGLEGCTYLDMIDGMQEKQQEGYIQVEQEVDRMFSAVTGPIKLVDAGWQRQVLIEAQNSESAIVWNPWIEKCQRTSQLLDDDYKKFVCIETAKVGKDFVQLKPNVSHEIKLIISSKSSS